MRILAAFLELIAFKTGRMRGLWVRFAGPSSYKYADFLRLHGGFYEIGPASRVNPLATITDPQFVRIGRNCAIAKSDLIGHNGVIGVLQNVYPGTIDSVGKIDIRDNSFIGHGAIVLPGVTIGPNSIVAAGALVSRDVPPGCVVGGVPAKVICRTVDYHEKLVERTKHYTWFSIIEQRDNDFNAKIEGELNKLRIKAFFDAGESSADYPAEFTEPAHIFEGQQ